LKTIYKLQVSSATPFKVLQMIKLNTYVIKLSLNFDINSTFDMKELVIYKTQELIHDTPFDIPIVLSSSLKQKEHINAILDAQVVFTKNGEVQ